MSYKDAYAIAVRSSVFVSCATLSNSSMSVGSGTVLHASLVLTNAHVVLRDNFSAPFDDIRVYCPRSVTGTPRFSSSAVVLFVDSALDVAILFLRDALPST